MRVIWGFTPLELSGYYMNQHTPKICILNYCVLYGYQDKRRLFPYTALTSMFIIEMGRVYCAVRTEYLNIIQVNCDSATAQVSSRGLSPRRPIFDLSPVYVQFVVEKVAKDQAFLPVFRFPLSTIFHQCPIHIFIYMLHLPQGNMGQVWEPSKN
jgi:hypothetical protein